jgi:hypothetical protein
MLDFLTRPLQSVFGVTERDVVDSIKETHEVEANLLDAVHAIEKATDSIERHVEVIESLATSVDPLRASVDRLTDTLAELVAMMAPIGAAEHDVQRIGRIFGRHRHDEKPPDANTKPPDANTLPS